MIAFTGFVTSVVLLPVQFGTSEFSPRFAAWFRHDRTLIFALSDADQSGDRPCGHPDPGRGEPRCDRAHPVTSRNLRAAEFLPILSRKRHVLAIQVAIQRAITGLPGSKGQWQAGVGHCRGAWLRDQCYGAALTTLATASWRDAGPAATTAVADRSTAMCPSAPHCGSVSSTSAILAQPKPSLPSPKDGEPGSRNPCRRIQKTLTQLVTTTSGSRRSTAIAPDCPIDLTCANRTLCNCIRRNRRAWRADGRAEGVLDCGRRLPDLP
jgi:hypothetical protein